MSAEQDNLYELIDSADPACTQTDPAQRINNVLLVLLLAKQESRIKAGIKGKWKSVVDENDVMQETYLRLLETRRQVMYRNAMALGITVAKRIAVDLYRHSGILDVTPLEEVNEDGDYSAMAVTDGRSLQDDLEMSEAAAITGEALLCALTERQAQILQLRAEGYSQKELAGELGISENTVEQHLRVARKAAREYVRIRGLDVYAGKSKKHVS